jgi:3-oxoacyl-[acyl-carrier protein] reductase
MTNKFSNKVALVTGASSGLGAEIALQLANEGAQVVIHYNTNKKGAEEVASQIKQQNSQAFLVQSDLSTGNLDQVAEKMISEVLKQVSTIDYLVNNAADQTLDPEDPMDEIVMNSIMFTNVLAPQAIVKACLNILKPGSSIVNITSVEAEHPFPNHSLYASSKAALTRYTELAAVELAALGVRCNAVAPGLVDRDGLDKSWPEGLKKWNERSPNKRPVTASEVAKTVSFLLSDDASGITGISVSVDGGWSVA